LGWSGAALAKTKRRSYDPKMSTDATSTDAGDGTGDDLVSALPKVVAASLIANLPMLGLLLVPQLMRSRAGSEAQLMVGASLYSVLILAALAAAPLVSALAAPKPGRWTAGTATRTALEIGRARPRDFWRRVGEWLGLFVLAQAVGLLVAWLLPYVWDNPGFGAPGEPRWILDYRNYAIQAVAIYLFSCVSYAWFGARLRQLAVGTPDRGAS
jgi:hypothetical protein